MCSSVSAMLVTAPRRSAYFGVFRSVATPLKDTVRRQEFAELSRISTAGAANVSFRCVTTVYRNSLSNEVMDAALDRLSAAPPETVLGISHYMHGEVCRVTPDSTAFPLRGLGGVHIRIGLDWNDSAAAPRLMRWAEEARRLLPALVRRTDLRQLPKQCRRGLG